ncbi:hypothetical protein L208DRAFT_1331640 [Tricholoma matsutake]|nr:hypothetical protein L208DRAFT_1331640 [Tricholoma matsutake 945]
MTHAIFRGLQEEIKEILQNLPTSVSSSIKQGLIDMHTKLSDYYHKYDKSPFYTWAALVDPRISYEGMKLDFAGDHSLATYLESSKSNLYDYYETHYADKHPALSQVTSSVPGQSVDVSAPPHSLKKNLHHTFSGR